MAIDYAFRPERPTAHDIVRIIDQLAADADDELAPPVDDFHEAIHESRKRFKEIRGLLRMARGALGDQYTRENRRFRDAGRALSDLRDATALIESLDVLSSRVGDALSDDVLESLHTALEARRDRIVRQAGDIRALFDEVRDSIRAGREALEGLHFDGDGFQIFEEGFKKTYGRARDRMADAYEEREGEAFHEWRKRVKYHRYHVRLVHQIWPETLAPRRRELKRLTDLLGDDHDLVVLAEVIEDESEFFDEYCDPEELDRLETAMERASDLLRHESRFVGERLFAEKPKHIYRRFRAYWRAWRSETATD